MEGKLLSHGFSSWISFIQASISLGITVGAPIIGAMLYFFDGRYASADISQQVGLNAVTSHRIELRLVAADYRTTWVDYCNAPSTQVRELYKQRLEDIEDDYKEITKFTKEELPRLIPCDEIRDH